MDVDDDARASTSRTSPTMPLRLLYAAVILCFLAVHGIAFHKLNALASDAPAISAGIASGD